MLEELTAPRTFPLISVQHISLRGLSSTTRNIMTSERGRASFNGIHTELGTGNRIKTLHMLLSSNKWISSTFTCLRHNINWWIYVIHSEHLDHRLTLCWTLLRCSPEDGQCHCLPNMVGRQCSDPTPRYFLPTLDYFLYEAELAAPLQRSSTPLPPSPSPSSSLVCNDE